MASAIHLGDNAYRLQVYVPSHIRHLVTPNNPGAKHVQRTFRAPSKNWAIKEAEKWERTLKEEWERNYNHIPKNMPGGHRARVETRDKVGAGAYNVLPMLNDLVREAFDAQEVFDRFDPNGSPESYVQLRQISADWDAANLRLVRYVVRNQTRLTRELGGRTSRFDKDLTIEA
jgi:hypothetical protein